MPPRRPDERQVRFTWIDPADVLASADRRGGAVVFEAPDTSRIVREKTPRLPRVKVAAKGREPESMGLPFGTRSDGTRVTCWSCGQEIGEKDLVRAGPGTIVCPGCGARLPFAE